MLAFERNMLVKSEVERLITLDLIISKYINLKESFRLFYSRTEPKIVNA
jgi:hypothetical protein